MLGKDASLTRSEVKEEGKDAERGSLEGIYYSAVSILFADFVGFTSMVEDSEPGELLDTLNTFFSSFDRILAKSAQGENHWKLLHVHCRHSRTAENPCP